VKVREFYRKPADYPFLSVRRTARDLERSTNR